ncbi:MAG: response regulator, partial [Rhizobacter sp.]
MTRILLTDDDEQIRTTLADYLRGFAFDVRTAATGAGFRDAIASGGLQAIVLDVMLPDANGLELCRWLRHQEDTTPVIMLTAQGDPVSRVIGLEMGADDYL